MTHMESNYFPEEVVTEILIRLPVKSVVRCGSVCKLWYSLIRNSNFISAHFQRTSIYPPSNDTGYRYFFVKEKGLARYQIVGSCNGLVCLSGNSRIVLWNPVLKKSFVLPAPDSTPNGNLCIPFVGFGFDSKTNDFKVLRMVKWFLGLDEFQFEAKIYSFNSNSWKDITSIIPSFCWKDWENFGSVFVNGALHWITSRGIRDELDRHVVMTFDISNEVFREIPLPQRIEYDNYLRIRLYGESSFAVQCRDNYYDSDLWVMEEYGVVSSWLKLAQICTWSRGYLTELRYNNGEVLHGYDHDELALKKLNGKWPRYYRALPKRGLFSFHKYVESMLLFDKENEEIVNVILDT